jgi:hypothetical protein
MNKKSITASALGFCLLVQQAVGVHLCDHLLHMPADGILTLAGGTFSLIGPKEEAFGGFLISDITTPQQKPDLNGDNCAASWLHFTSSIDGTGYLDTVNGSLTGSLTDATSPNVVGRAFDLAASTFGGAMGTVYETWYTPSYSSLPYWITAQDSTAASYADSLAIDEWLPPCTKTTWKSKIEKREVTTSAEYTDCIWVCTHSTGTVVSGGNGMTATAEATAVSYTGVTITSCPRVDCPTAGPCPYTGS